MQVTIILRTEMVSMKSGNRQIHMILPQGHLQYIKISNNVFLDFMDTFIIQLFYSFLVAIAY